MINDREGRPHESVLFRVKFCTFIAYFPMLGYIVDGESSAPPLREMHFPKGAITEITNRCDVEKVGKA